MNRTQKIAILLVLLLALTGVAAYLLATYFTSHVQGFPFSPRPSTRPNPAADLEFYYLGHAVLSTINIVLTIIIIVNYADIYLKTKSPFTIGLLMFAMLFLIKDITFSPFVIGFFNFGILGLGPFIMIPDMFETAALLILFYFAVKY